MSENLKTDLAKLLLRLSVGGLMLFHGVSKLLNGHHHIIELNLLFLFSAVAIALLGPGQLRLGRKNHNSKQGN